MSLRWAYPVGRCRGRAE